MATPKEDIKEAAKMLGVSPRAFVLEGAASRARRLIQDRDARERRANRFDGANCDSCHKWPCTCR